MMKIVLSSIIALTLSMSGCVGPSSFFDEDDSVEEPYVFDLTLDCLLYTSPSPRDE